MFVFKSIDDITLLQETWNNETNFLCFERKSALYKRCILLKVVNTSLCKKSFLKKRLSYSCVWMLL